MTQINNNTQTILIANCWWFGDDSGDGGRSSSCNQWVAGLNRCSVRLSHYVLGQDNSPAFPTDGGQRTRWCQLYGSLTSVNLPQDSCGYNVAQHCECMYEWVND
ncbi:hypothetical protein XENORESO_003038 [Xenotaenia resolanae]|uniref:Uncharacterized protein n=1 Tax=Xenotaenia resolanae TaxID=208358 RepID=A0ABV0VP97_9TELE